ncbi:rhodanese-like domain-containing protein 4, chloroplastic [Zingiber officinale]|uniref:rhodanese-like domain-containing protein 4, chloroplastic n=1 Tax=Zingiber officinale TaxID=94328 RepID=UPI001C4CA538|nr:rhodanese-like domain-containing protein 4, chloroplastic [Zingiber officinale]
MEVLNAIGLTPLASLHKAASSSSSPGKRVEARRSLLPLRIRNLAALSSVLGAGGLTRALTYEEALNQTFGSFSPFPDFDLSGLLDGIVSFVTNNPLVVVDAGLPLAVPLVISQVLNLAQSWGVESAKGAINGRWLWRSRR